MSYTKYEPSELLKPYVSFYYVWERNDYLETPIDVKGQATNNCVLVFNYGDRYKLYNHNSNGIFLPKSFLTGYSLSPFRLRLMGEVSMFGVVFKGTRFTHLFNMPRIFELHDSRIDFEFVVRNESVMLNERLHEAGDNHERVSIVENYLKLTLSKTFNGRTKIDMTAAVIDIIEKYRGMVRMDDIARYLESSPRHMRRNFVESTGIGPKHYARLKRFNYVNLCLSKDPELSWIDFIDEGGYYDQSHFIKDYLEFTGEKPDHFLQNMRETRKDTEEIKEKMYIFSKA